MDHGRAGTAAVRCAGGTGPAARQEGGHDGTGSAVPISCSQTGQGEPQHPAPMRVPAATRPGPGQLSSRPVPPADAKTQRQCLAVSSFASKDALPADKEWKKLKSEWFWSAALSKPSGLLQSKHNSDEGFTLVCTQRCCPPPSRRSGERRSETVGLLRLSERGTMVLLSPCPCA